MNALDADVAGAVEFLDPPHLLRLGMRHMRRVIETGDAATIILSPGHVVGGKSWLRLRPAEGLS